MSFRNAFGIYQVLKQHLEHADHPLTCVDLFEQQDVRSLVEDANRVSDYLGHMWRRGLLSRYPAPKDGNTMARYAYSWKDPKKQAPAQRNPTPQLRVLPTARTAAAAAPVAQKQQMSVEQTDAGIVIDLPNLTLTIKTK